MASSAEGRRIVPPRHGSGTVAAHAVPEASHGLGLTHGMWGVVIFISSEVMFFAALFTAYFYLRAQNVDWAPPLEGVSRPGAWPFRGAISEWLPTLNTLILVSSSFTMQFGINALKRSDRAGFIRLLGITMLMGVIFLAFQGWEYSKLFEEHLVPQTGLFGGIFFGLTGFHFAHVSGGVIFMLIVLARALAGQFDAHRHLAVEAAGIYWHFVDVVWIGLYSTIYVL
jgi:cytochrome c oxidase subunit III